MGYDVTHVMREYTKEIDFIMTATRAGPEDVQERGKVASALTYSLAAAKKRTGKTTSVEDTDLYKLAQAIREAGSQEDCAAAVKRAFPRRWSIIFERYDLDWKIPECKTALRAGKAKKRRPSGIEAEVETLEKDVKGLDRDLEALTKQIRNRHRK